MSAQQPEVDRLSRAEYEALCREACAGYTSPIPEEVLWFAVCKNV